jgi:hypothetical protein
MVSGNFAEMTPFLRHSGIFYMPHAEYRNKKLYSSRKRETKIEKERNNQVEVRNKHSEKQYH